MITALTVNRVFINCWLVDEVRGMRVLLDVCRIFAGCALVFALIPAWLAWMAWLVVYEFFIAD